MSASVLQRNNVVVAGNGQRSMVFAHGYGCDQRMWRFVAPSFADEYRLILFDHVGSGQSDLAAYDRRKYSALEGYADDLLEICAELDIRHGVFVGHSVSAVIGILAALREPDRFDRLVLIGPSPRYLDDDGYVGGFCRRDVDDLLDLQERNYLGWASGFAPVVVGHPDRPELADELAESFCRNDPAIAQQFAAVTFLADNRADLGRVTMPTLILQCMHDAIAPLAVGEYVHGHILNSRLAVLATTGHCPHLSEPDQTVAAIRAFLDE